MTVVFKLGGSLMALRGLEKKLLLALEQRSTEHCLIVPGGGESANIVREWNQIHELSDETAHWLAISSTDLNRRLLENLLEFQSACSRETARRFWSNDRRPLLVDLMPFVTEEEKSGAEPLPHNWTVTSDSLAAWIAVRWPAEELILLKSAPTPVGMTVDEAGRQGLVDDYFPLIANRLGRISWCNLRGSKIVIETWLSNIADFTERASGDD